MPFTNDLQERRNKLQLAYLRSLPSKARELRHCWQQCRQQGWPPASVHQLFILVHRLTGSGSTFGLPQLSESAKPIEKCLHLAQQQQILPPDQRFELEHHLDALCRLLTELTDHTPASLPPAPHGNTVLPATARQLPLIYLAEDDSLQGQALAHKLATYGYKVRTFTDIPTLEQAVRARRPDALLLDIVFPEDALAGLHAAQQLPQLHNPPIPTLFLSQRDDIHTRLDASRSGAVAYLTKPINPLQLINRLEALLGTQPPARARVLIVDDDEDVSHWYATLFNAADMDTRVINDPLDVMPSLVEFRPELLVLDLHMPGANGIEITRALRQEVAYHSLPIMIVSRDNSTTQQLACLDAGADDYLIKPVEEAFLTRLVRRRIERQRHLQQAIARDPLTGLLNRSAFLERFEVILAMTLRNRGKLCVALLDIDRFQELNQQQGHLNGDIILKTVARHLAANIRRTDLMGRFDGDEFALVLPDTSLTEAHTLLGHLLEHIGPLSQATQPLSLSVGLMASDGQQAPPMPLDTDQLLAMADQALWTAKQAGGRRIEMTSTTPKSRRE